MRRSTRICRKPPPNRPNHPSFSLKIGSFVTPSGRATLGVGKSTLREERARRALLFSKTGRLLPIEVLESVLQGCFGCDDHASRFRHQLRIRIQRSDSETRKLRCLLACEYLVTPRDLRDDGLGSLRGCLCVSGRSRHTIFDCDWSQDVCSSDLLGIRDRRRVLYPQHPQVNLLREVGGVGALPDAPVEEVLQRPAVRRKQSFHQLTLSFSHAAHRLKAGRYAPISTRVARRALGHPYCGPSETAARWLRLRPVRPPRSHPTCLPAV